MTDAVSFSEFARVLDVSPSYVTKLRDAGRLVLTGDGKRVVVEASRVRIKETESGSPQHTAARESHARRRGAGNENGRDVDPPDSPRSPETSRAYWERREAAARAQTREIELAKLRGELVETAVVRAAGIEAGGVLRSTLENVPDQLAPLLAEGDPEREARIYAQLRDHIEQVLTEISRKLEALSNEVAQQ